MFPYGIMDLDSIPSTASFALIATVQKAQGMTDYLEATSTTLKNWKIGGWRLGWGQGHEMKKQNKENVSALQNGKE